MGLDIRNAVPSSETSFSPTKPPWAYDFSVLPRRKSTRTRRHFNYGTKQGEAVRPFEKGDALEDDQGQEDGQGDRRFDRDIFMIGYKKFIASWPLPKSNTGKQC